MTECCCTYDDQGEYPSIYEESFPQARKVYRCCECRGTILPGQKHHKAHGLWDGEWLTYRTCMACHQIRLDYCNCGWAFGQLHEHIYERYDFNYLEVTPDAAT